MGGAEVLIKFKGDTTDVKSKTDQVSSGLENLTSKLTLANIAAEAFSYGMRLVSSGLDDAISRVDTMNNFPRVMSNLGISAEESAEVINDLSEKLQGLPTTLDEAALAVQKITAKNGDVKEAEKIYLAMNNAILAGGAPAANQASSMQQLAEAYARGKPDMIEWRNIMTTMPAQLKQVANAMGYVDAASLGEAVRADGGEAEFQRMIDTMVQLNQTGYDTFPSLEQQARNATGGIGTSVKNMKTAFVRGIGDILMSIDEALEPLGGISGVLKTIGKVGESVFKKIGSVLKKVIPKIIEFGKWINQNKKWIVPLTAAVATFVVTFSTVKKIISIIKSVQAAFALLAANPFAAIIAGIAALVVGFIYLWNNCEEFRNFWITLWNGIKTAVKVVIDSIVVIFQSVVTTIQTIWNVIYDYIVTPIMNAWNGIQSIFMTVATWITKNVINPVASIFTNLWNGVKTTAKGAWEGIKSIFSGFANFFKTIFTNAWNGIMNLFKAGGNIFNTIKDGVLGGFKTVVNKLIDGINDVVAIPFNGINNTLKTLKKVNIMGLKPFGWVGTISVPQIPHLNVGTNYVPEDTLAMIHKGEAVIPKKFNPYANNIDLTTLGSLNHNRNNQVIVYANFKQNSLGQTVRDIKTFSGGARNDFNYGVGV